MFGSVYKIKVVQFFYKIPVVWIESKNIKSKNTLFIFLNIFFQFLFIITILKYYAFKTPVFYNTQEECVTWPNQF